MFKIRSLIIVILLSTACGLVQRHPESGYQPRWDDVGEPSYGSARTLSQPEREKVEGDVEIRRLENNIRSEDEYNQYNRYKSTMSNRERSEFLKMKDTSSRSRWVQAKGISEDRNRFSRSIASAVEEGDVVVGMPKEAVKESWGDPENVEVAGNPQMGNERWTYTRYISSVEGYQREERVLYFEKGNVIGWEKK
jgi:hypothetical protein